jgi:tRNA(His) 5'-end guanylyltransferase
MDPNMLNEVRARLAQVLGSDCPFTASLDGSAEPDERLVLEGEIDGQHHRFKLLSASSYLDYLNGLADELARGEEMSLDLFTHILKENSDWKIVSPNSNVSLGDRMKRYENAFSTSLPWRLPVIIRVDGKAFHSWTRGLKRPFDEGFMAAMDAVALNLCQEISGAVLAYVQSDEISVLAVNDQTIQTEPWFGNQVQKLVSVSAAIASARMTAESVGLFDQMKIAHFDARAFVLPDEGEVANYLIWRQQDASRNSLQSLARSLYSDKELHKKRAGELHDLCHAKGHNWNDLPIRQKRGRCVVREKSKLVTDSDGTARVKKGRWYVDNAIPIFTDNGSRKGLEYVGWKRLGLV